VTVFRFHLSATCLAAALAAHPAVAHGSGSQGAGGPTITAQTCLGCHGVTSLAVTDSSGHRRSLYVDGDTFHASIHGSFDCRVCHEGITSIPHAAVLPLVNCGKCHTEQAARYNDHGGKKEVPGDYFPACWDCHGTHDILPGSDSLSRVYPANLPATCGRCHADTAIVGKYHIPTIQPVAAFIASVHARKPAGGKQLAATCVDCHSATATGHQILPPIDPRSTIFHFNIPRTCGRCHTAIVHDYEQSSHGQVAVRGEADAPVCTTSPGEHRILPVSDPRSPVYATNVSLVTCGPCHASRLMNQKYGLPTGIMRSWQHSYHGLKSSDGDPEVANCASCHTAHHTLPPSSSASTVNPANLHTSCGQCHRGISAAVYHVPIHATTGIALNHTGQVLQSVYIIAIVVIIGLMVVHWLIDLSKHVRLLNRRQQIVRMRWDELWQHTLLMLSFTVLAITGFAFQYSGSFWARFLFGWQGGFALRHTIHRVAAVVFIATAVWHVVYLTRSRGRRFLRDMFPARADFRQFWQMIAFNLGWRRDGPRFARFSYIEKAEYWAMVWGTVVMTVTGLGLWFGNVTERMLQVRAIGVMLVVHFYEAVLAGLAILVWHFYSTIFSPTVYPNNPSWYTGTMPIDMYRREHPDDPVLEGVVGGGAADAEEGAGGAGEADAPKGTEETEATERTQGEGVAESE
jgi:cytochrome b subunit of formate dehydrogenase